MSMKNSNDTSWDRISDLPICSTAPLPLCYRGPQKRKKAGKYLGLLQITNDVYVITVDSRLATALPTTSHSTSVTAMANGSRNFAQLTQFLDRRAHELTKTDFVGNEGQMVIREERDPLTHAAPNTDFSTVRL